MDFGVYSRSGFSCFDQVLLKKALMLLFTFSSYKRAGWKLRKNDRVTENVNDRRTENLKDDIIDTIFYLKNWLDRILVLDIDNSFLLRYRRYQLIVADLFYRPLVLHSLVLPTSRPTRCITITYICHARGNALPASHKRH